MLIKNKTSNNSLSSSVNFNDLLPCPFCGRKADIIENYDGWHGYRCMIMCSNIECISVSTYWCSNKIDAINKWNTRVS